MSGITEKNGVLYVWGIPCSRDENYKFSLAEYLGLTIWVCPHCEAHLSYNDDEIICINNCHKNKRLNK